MVAVEDAHPITRQTRWQSGLELLDDRNEPFAQVMNQGRRYGGLGMVELIVQGAEADADLGGIGLLGGVVRAMNATDDEGGNIDERGEQEFMRILMCSGVGEQLVEEFRAKSVLQGATEHDRERTAVRKALKDLSEEHVGPPD
jgi:hypothetical protein